MRICIQINPLSVNKVGIFVNFTYTKNCSGILIRFLQISDFIQLVLKVDENIIYKYIFNTKINKKKKKNMYGMLNKVIVKFKFLYSVL